MKQASVVAVMSCLILGLGGRSSDALNEPSHQVINDQATRRSQFDEVLKQQLGLRGGIEELFKGQAVFQWIRLGGASEDNGTRFEYLTGKVRSFRHFHDPLLPWDRAGLQYLLFPRFESSVRWAQRTDQDGETGYGNYSWPHARRYYLTALTDPDPTVREQGFANTFRALGQIMHLIVDASVPEHVRNDAHPMGEVLDYFGQVGNYEYWVLAQHRIAGTEPRFIQEYLTSPITLDPDLLKMPVPSSETVALVPIARLFDSDRYTGLNPWVTAESKIGIAEIANANFVSEDTRQGQYPHPARANMDKYIGTYSKLGEKRAYYKLKPGGGLEVNPVATECALDELTGFETFCVDDDVWRETARRMLPRAVRYGQEVLDYFFRGMLDVKREPDPETDQPSLRIMNRSSEELGKDGILTLYQDDLLGTRSPVPGASLKLEATVPKDNDDAPLRLPISADLPAGGLTLVYKGPLGTEAGAVIGKVVRPVRVEEVYRDRGPGEWILRTKDGLYVLPLEAIAGLTAPLYSVTWGDRDNQLVGLTRAGGPDPYQGLLFELDRPPGSSQVPTAGTSATGRPIVALRLVQRVALYEVLPTIDLHTTVEVTNRIELTQYAVTYTINMTCQDVNPSPTWDAYDCTTTVGDDAVSPPMTLWNTPATAQFSLQLEPGRHRATQSPPLYGWSLNEVRADRNARLVATVLIEATHFPENEIPRRVPMREFDSNGVPVASDQMANLLIAEPNFWVAAVVDLTNRRLLAKSSADKVRLDMTTRNADVMSASNYFLVGIRYDIKYVGGSLDGKRDLTWDSSWQTQYLPPGTPTREGPYLTALRGISLNSLEGLFRPSLTALGLGAVEGRGTVEASPWDPGLAYRYEPDGTAVLLGGRFISIRQLGPAPSPDWIRWMGPAPGRLGFQSSSWEMPSGDEARTWSVNWNLATDTATLAYTETAPEPWFPFTGNALGLLSTRFDEPGWLWVPWTGEPKTFPDQVYTSAWNYVALDPDYLYNVVSGRFHTLRADLPAEAGPDPLVPGSLWGEYHVVGR